MAQEQHPEEKPDAQSGDADGEGSFGDAFAERATADARTETKPPEQAGEKPAESEPADKAGSEAAPAESKDKEAAGDKTSGTAKQADPWENLTPEQQRAAFVKLQASERSQRGRVGALTKKLNQQTRTAEKPSEAKPEEKPAEADGETASAATLDEKLDAIADQYGDVNGPLVEAIKAIRAEIADMKPKVEKVDLDKDAEELAKAYEALEGKHPDYAEYTNENEAFVKWVEAQPPKVQDLLNSFDPDEVSLGLTLYKAESKVASTAAEEDDEGKTGSTATGEKRKRQLDGLRDVKTRGAPAAAGVPDEFGAAFKARAQQAPA